MTFIKSQQEEARSYTCGEQNSVGGTITYVITSEKLDSLISKVVQKTVEVLEKNLMGQTVTSIEHYERLVRESMKDITN